jgi:hypothetical protein
MKLPAGLQNKIGEFVLKRQLKHLKRNVKSCNIDQAKKIGILFNATHSVSFDIVKNLVKELSDKSRTIMVLGFVDSKQLIDHYLYRKGFEFFTQSHLNWYHLPKSDAVNEFINKDFDILIDLSLEDLYPLKYILSQSKALFKVGKLTDTHTYLDFMIDIEQEKKAMSELQLELKKDSKNTKVHQTSYDSIADIKTSVELQMNFLINQLLHYLSMLK